MPITPQARVRLDAAMDARRVHLDLRWKDVADRARLSMEAVNAIRTGRTRSIRPRTAAAIERALQWQPGSIAAVTGGGEPVPVAGRDAGAAEEYLRRTPGLSAAEIEDLLAHVRGRREDGRREDTDRGAGRRAAPSG